MTGSLDELLNGYLELRWGLDPVEATYVGRHELDGLFASYTPERVREFVAALRSYAGSLEEAEAASLPEEIDRTAALHAARHDILVLEWERPFASNPAYLFGHVLNGLYLLLARNAQDPPRRAAALLERLRAVPDFLTEAAEVLDQPVAIFIEAAAAMLPGGLALVREALDDSAVDLTSLDPAELAEARTAAAQAMMDFGDALVLMREDATDDFAIGRDLFDRKLHTAHMIQENADELMRFGERLRAEAEATRERIAEEIDPGAGWLRVLQRLREDMPSPETAIAEYAAAMRTAREFTVSHELMAVPPAELDVVPTPGFLRALTPFAAYQGAGAFDADQTGIFFVTLPAPGEPWRTHCRAELLSTSVHEGVPGHHQQISTANGLPSDVRRVLATPAAQEGWALYCETLMMEQGLLCTPAQRFIQAHHLLWRAWRVILDVSLHTRGMSMAKAARLLQEHLGFDAASAESEARRYCAYPTYQLCYAVGRRDIMQLREDTRAARGASFALAAFHDELLAYGALPTVLARWGMEV
ncbi:MAG TPA: DUF885 domain-containing protein [Gemmatimonadaceae bacterium]|nr:DUF885 domain-containing protein [Gemmatimonadaceae bacterium]